MDYTKKFTLTGLITSLSTALVIVLASLIYGATRAELIRNSVFGLFFSAGLVFSILYFHKAERLDYDNGTHPYRFLITYSVCLVLVCFFPLIDVKGWVFLGPCIALCLFTNSLLGLYCSAGLIMIPVLLSESTDSTVFLVYFMACFVSVLLFQNVENNFRVAGPVIISSMVLFAVETAGFVLPENLLLTAERFLMPLVNVILNVLILLLCLKYFNEFIADRYRIKYLELNDQGYSALIKLKEKSPEEYFRSIHTAYLAERMAKAIGCDYYVAKNCAYYHRIKKAFSYNFEEVKKFVLENGFPPKAAETLLGYLSKKQNLSSKEAGIVYICDKFISSIQLIFQKNSEAKIDYKDLIEKILEKDYVVKSLDSSDLSIKDMGTIKQIVLKETLYYDFLR